MSFQTVFPPKSSLMYISYKWEFIRISFIGENMIFQTFFHLNLVSRISLVNAKSSRFVSWVTMCSFKFSYSCFSSPFPTENITLRDITFNATWSERWSFLVSFSTESSSFLPCLSYWRGKLKVYSAPVLVLSRSLFFLLNKKLPFPFLPPCIKAW